MSVSDEAEPLPDEAAVAADANAVNAADEVPSTTTASCDNAPGVLADEEKTATYLNIDETTRVAQQQTEELGPPPPKCPIDYSNLDETPYEHNFVPGDHIIRWDMLPILWPIQIHGIVLEVSDDKSEVTICDFGITSVKNDADDKKIAKFNEAIKEECQVSIDGSSTKKEVGKQDNKKKEKKKQRLNVIKLTKWSDLKKWSKVNYEVGLLTAGGKGGAALEKGLKSLGKHTENAWKQTENAWSSMTKSFIKKEDVPKNDDSPKEDKKMWRSVRCDVDDSGFCCHHPEIQLRRQKEDGEWTVVRKKCPMCIKEDCPVMLGEERQSASETSPVEKMSNSAITEAGVEQEASILTNGTVSDNINSEIDASKSIADDGNDTDGGVGNGVSGKDLVPDVTANEPKTLAQQIAAANEVESNRKIVKGPPSPERKSKRVDKQTPWHSSLVKSFTNMFPQKNEKGSSSVESSTNKVPLARDAKQTKSVEQEGQGVVNSTHQRKTMENLPRSDPTVLVLARTRFILEHGENVLPPYHIINSNSECIAVWCKTGRWSTFQASVFLHSSAIGYAKSATAATIGAAAMNPWLIPAVATVGLAAVGTPWLFLKVANDKWNEATNELTEKFWMQAGPEVFVECIEKWSNCD
ncbi:hypothetical protein ACHAXH_000690 [Discostella pseudostelligera]